jgi:hypothetical protein
MEIVTIEYSRTRQVAQYEPENLKVVANLGEGEDWLEQFNSLKNEVNSALGLAKKIVKEQEVKDEQKKTTKKKVATKKTATKKTTKNKAASGPKAEPEEEENYSAADVKSALIKVVKGRGRNVAEEILKDFGYGHSSEVEEENFGKVIAACEKMLEA